MSFSADPTVPWVVERDVDLVLVQLLQSSVEFRSWFARQVGLESSRDGFSGVRHSEYTDNGESDIEAGFETQTGLRHAVLIENKIDASMQDRQVERYYERGDSYLEDEWDAFTVCLVAPEAYVSRTHRSQFEAIVTYEEILEETESLDYDGGEFVTDLLQRSLEKRTPADYSELTSAIRERTLARVDELPDVVAYQTSNKHARLESTHGDHPFPVLYNAYIHGPDDGDKAIVRINLTGRDTYDDREVSALHELFVHEFDTPTGFETRGRPMDAVKKEVRREEFGSHEEYLEAIAEELSTLVDFYHPRLLRADLPEESP